MNGETFGASEAGPGRADRLEWDPGPTNEGAWPLRILLAEDDHELRWLLSVALSRDGHQVRAVRDGNGLLSEVQAPAGLASGRSPDLIISDQCMPGPSGLQVLADLRTADWTTPFVLVTAYADGRVTAEASRLGAVVVAKPFNMDILRAGVARAVHALGPLY